MNNLKTVAPGSAIEKRVLYKVTKVNKKSIVISDVKGNTETIRERDYHNYNALITTGEGTNRANGRFPRWANTEAKRDFVRQARHANNSATEADWRVYQDFRKSFK